MDADGSPDSYRVDGNGLSYTCDGVVALDGQGRRISRKTDPEHWQLRCREAWQSATSTGDYSKVAIFGFLTEPSTGRPIIQTDGDPLPGKAYITTTTVSVPGAPPNTQRHWINASEIPYVVLPSDFVRRVHVKPGALAIVYRPKTDSLAYAVYGDGGDFGEGSIKLHMALQNNPIVVVQGIRRAKQGISDEVITAIFPAQPAKISSDAAAWNKAITDEGEQTVARLGGPAAVKRCLNK
ncbi:glycoside hydrolase family 75 protein [Paraburkholderia sediminicola]|uniref:glycoside hydrolase family 75 protein n=1 Tax=Paraburkholderia sediminicola TaxID=458836 RepID=UPI0038B91FF7